MIPLTFAYQTITVFSKFNPIITLSLSLLIPAIIIELFILGHYLKTSFWKSFRFCLIINFIASLAAILFGALFGYSPHVIIFLICWVALPIVIILIENIIYQKNWKVVRKKELLQALITINLIAYFIFTVSISLIISSCVKGERINRLRCISNFKQIGLGMAMYADDHKGFLPNKPGIEGLEQLRGNGYSNYNSFYQCPSCNPLKVCEQKLSKEIVDYIYRSGLKISVDKDIDYSKIPVAWDKSTNHENYGNVLFLDGHVKGFKGSDWIEQAGIKKTATQQGK
jgi:prepilin-type processing-associated H-X9-DG protein